MPPPSFMPPPLTSAPTPFAWGWQEKWTLLAATGGGVAVGGVLSYGTEIGPYFHIFHSVAMIFGMGN